MEIIDNFLPEYQFKQLESKIMDSQFHWYFTNEQAYFPFPENELHNFMFNHSIISVVDGKSYIDDEITYSSFDPVLMKLGSYRIFRIKINLTTRTENYESCGFHVDGFGNSITSIYYINTNNGYTEFETGEKVKSVANRMLIFDSDLSHQGVSCTDQKRRVVVNFNYKKT